MDTFHEIAPLLPVVEEAAETRFCEPDTGCCSEVERAVLEKVEERVLEDFGPNREVLEGSRRETLDDGVGDVANSRL